MISPPHDSPRSSAHRRLWLIAAAVAQLAIGACAGGSSNTGPCKDYGNALCDMACACTAGGGCIVEEGDATITFQSDGDCRAFYVDLGCNEPSASIDYDACTKALDQASCVAVPGPTGDSQMALDHPVCE